MRLTILAVSALAVLLPTAARAQPTRGAVDLSGPLTYFIGEGPRGSGFEEGDRTLARWALEAWGRQLDPPVRLELGSESSAAVRIHFVPAGGGQYGEMRAGVLNGRVVADVFVRPDTDGLGPDIARRARLDPLFREAIVFLTCVHELGHAFGLPHTREFADIMYSFQFGGDLVDYFARFREQLEVREDIRSASPFSPADVRTLRALHR